MNLLPQSDIEELAVVYERAARSMLGLGSVSCKTGVQQKRTRPLLLTCLIEQGINTSVNGRCFSSYRSEISTGSSLNSWKRLALPAVVQHLLSFIASPNED